MSHMCRDAPTRAIALNFDMRGDVAYVITHVKCYINRFMGFGVLTTFLILPLSIGLVGRPYNIVSTTVLYCDPI